MNRQWSKATSAKILFKPHSRVGFSLSPKTFLYKGSSAKHYDVDDNNADFDDDDVEDDSDDGDDDDDDDDIVYCRWKCKLPAKFVRTCTW